MPERTDHPPSTNDPPRRTAARRAIIGGVAAVALLVGPVVLANLIVPNGSGSDRVEAASGSDTSAIALRRDAIEAANAKNELEQFVTTTTTAPPPPPTTVPAPKAPPTTAAPKLPPTTAPPTTQPPPPPPPAAPPPPPDSGGGLGDPSSYATWDALAQCESGGNWSINSGNGYYGGLQFSLSTWQSVGGTGLPSDASRETQILMGQRLQARSGWGSWPACSAKLGYL